MEADIVIIGGGLAGLSLAALLGTAGIDVVCIDRDTPESQLQAAFDGRTTAISYGSRQVLEAAGLWDDLAEAGDGACPIETIHILDGASRTPDLIFDRFEVGCDAFGWIVENRDFRQCLFERVRALPSVRHVAPANVTDFARDDRGVTVTTTKGGFRAPLIIGADGRQSATRDWMGIGTRRWSYRQQAIVCAVIHDNPHHNVAIEHFRAAGPFAALPMVDDAEGNHRSALVWTEHGPLAPGKSAKDWPEDVFNAALTARFPSWYGAVRVAGARYAYPLGLVHAHDYIAPRAALVAEAAHGIHPIAGQGLNMGFRDIALIGQLIIEAVRAGRDPGADALLQAYQRGRRIDNMAMAGATDTLNRLFSNEIPPVARIRRIGLKAVSRMPGAKRFFMRQAMGSGGVLPELIRGGAGLI